MNNIGFVSNYADDTNLLVVAKNIVKITLNADTLLTSVSSSLLEETLVLNWAKINSILFKTNRSLIEPPTEIALGKTVVSVSKEVKFLGVVINEFLSWKGYISELCSRLSSVT